MAGFCGTGAGNFPQPGDPDLNGVVLSAAPAFGGIDVSWTYSDLNPHAVAYTILYRSTSGTEATKVKHRTVTGDFYYDKTTSATLIEYFYWIQVVSVNGTIGDLIGPVSATARPTIQQIMESLTGQIEEGFLGQTLKTRLDEIDLNKQAIYDEAIARAANDDALGVAFNQVLAQSDDTLALLQEEINARTAADSATISQVNTLVAQANDDLAAVQLSMGAFIEQVNGDLQDIGAYFSLQTDVNGVIGGFGVYNNGEILEAGFDVDRFWVGRTDLVEGVPVGTKPFIIENDEVFIKEAVIQSLTFDKLRSADGSLMFTPAVYDEMGNVVEDGKLKADYIEAGALEVEDLSVTNAKIANGAITEAKIVNGAISNAKIENAAITEAKIANAAVDTLQIKGQAVTFPRGVATAASVSVAYRSWSTVQSITANLTGAPIILHASLVATTSSDYSNEGWVRILRGGSVIWSEESIIEGESMRVPFATSIYISNPGSGNQTFSLQMMRAAGSGVYARKRYIAILEAKR